MLTRFPIDPNQLNSPRQVRSYAAYQRILDSRDSITRSALELDGTADDYDGTRNDNVVLFEKSLMADGPLFTGFANANGTIGMDTKSQKSDGSRTTTTETSIEFKHLEDGEDLLTHKATKSVVDTEGRSASTNWTDVFQISESEGYVVHQFFVNKS